MNSKIKSGFKWCFILCVIFVSGITMLASAAYLYLAPLLPSAETYRHVQLETPLRVYSSDLKLIDEIGNRRTPVSFEEIPLLMKQAVIASEDPRFYSHPGVDVKGLMRGFWGFIRRVNLGGGSTITMQLANNISFGDDNVYLRKVKEIPFALQIQQELSKEEILTLYLNLIYFGAGADGIGAAAFIYYGKTVDQLTLAEAAMMVSLLPCPSPCNPLSNPQRAQERRNRVLQKMLEQDMITQMEYQQAVNEPVSATQHGRNTEIDAPYLVEMVRQQLYDIYGEETYTRGFDVITTLDSKMQTAANEAITNGIEVYYDKPHGYRGPQANYPADPLEPQAVWLKELNRVPVYGNQRPAIVSAVNERSIEVLSKGGESISIPWQGLSWARPFISQNNAWPPPATASDVAAVGDLVQIKKEAEGWALGQIPELEAALVSMSPGTGAILALVGGYDFNRSQVNRVLTPRPPGSNFKPFLYGAALEQGYSVANLINDAPITRGSYRPNNYENNFLGPITLRNALKDSRNVPAVRLYEQLGSQIVLPFAAKFGFQTQNFPHNDLTVALGSQDVQPIELATAYSVIANGGHKVEPWFIQQINEVNGETIYTARPAIVCDSCGFGGQNVANEPSDYTLAPQIIDPRIAYILNSLLRSVVVEGSGRGVNRAFKRNDLMGKTGTTNGPRELWFSGFNRDIATTVFVGFDQPTPLGESEQGATIPIPIWIDYMKVALEGIPENTMKRPSGLVDRLIDKNTGKLALPGDDNTMFEYFRSENAPKMEGSKLPGTRSESKEGQKLSTETIF